MNAHSSDPGSGRNDGTFWDHHDSVPDEIIVAIHVFRFTCRRDDDVVADARVLVDDCSPATFGDDGLVD